MEDSGCEGALGDPLFSSVDDVVLAVLGQDRLGREVLDVRAGLGLGDGEADALLARHDVGEDAVLELLGAKVVDGRAAWGARGEL